MTKNKLTKNEFANALKRGKGRALMHVQQHGLDNVSSIVLKSTLKNLSYDRQCESSRTEWLFSMFSNTNELPDFSAAILNAISTETEIYDLQHLCEFAELLAKNGDLKAHHQLSEIVLNQPLPDPQWPYGTHQLVALDGIDAVVAIAKRFGALLLDKKPESSIWLGDFADDIPSAKRKLARLAKTETNIKAFLDNQNEQKKRFAKKPKAKSKKEASEIELSCEEFVNHFFTKVGKEDYHFELKMMDRRLARNAYDEDLVALLERLNDEEDEAVIVRVLRVFNVAELPEITPLFWKLVESKNVDIRDAAVDALAKIQDARLSELARNKLKSKNFKAKDAAFIQLFTENFTNQDEQLILNALKQTSFSDDVAHSVGFAIREIYRANEELVTSDLLQWDYERNPCTECRCSTVGLMMDLKGMTPEMLEECQYDSNEEIRQLVTLTALAPQSNNS
jgi:hypothetical protein